MILGVGFETSSQKAQSDDLQKGVIESALKKTFAPEFLNRIDDFIIFNSLDKKAISKIVEIELKKLMTRVEKLGYSISLTKSAKSFIVEKGYDTKYGARPLKRALQKYVEDLIAEQIVSNSINDGDSITIDHLSDDKELTISKVKATTSWKNIFHY